MTTKTYLTAPELAARWATTVGSLANLRYRQQGPDYTKLGRRVLYPLDAVEEYESANLVCLSGNAA